MTNQNWPDDVKDEAQKALDTVRTGEGYLRENPIPVLLGVLLIGAALGALLRPAPRKEPDPVEAIRDWLEKALADLSAKWPKAKKQARAIQDDLLGQAQEVRKKLNLWS